MKTRNTHGGTRVVTAQLTLHIVRALRFGPRRFAEIGRAVNVAHLGILSKHLRKMERDGLIRRAELHGGGVEFSLTRLGLEYLKPAAALLDFVTQHEDEIIANRELYLAREMRERPAHQAELTDA